MEIYPRDRSVWFIGSKSATLNFGEKYAASPPLGFFDILLPPPRQRLGTDRAVSSDRAFPAIFP